jgi:hypothetical protein
MPCSSCSKDKVFSRGLCSGCYSRLRRTGSLARTKAVNKGRTCKSDGCFEPATAKGFCYVHYDKSQHPLYTTWKLLRSRYPGQYPKSWCKFPAFLTDVGERPGKKHQLRRKNPEKPYSSENVHWIEPIPVKPDYFSKDGRKAYGREWTLRTKYGISGDQYKEMADAQNWVCAVCHQKSDASLHVDHCHSTGKVRGLLCTSCNRMLGYAKDNTETLKRAISYLAR